MIELRFENVKKNFLKSFLSKNLKGIDIYHFSSTEEIINGDLSSNYCKVVSFIDVNRTSSMYIKVKKFNYLDYNFEDIDFYILYYGDETIASDFSIFFQEDFFVNEILNDIVAFKHWSIELHNLLNSNRVICSYEDEDEAPIFLV